MTPLMTTFTATPGADAGAVAATTGPRAAVVESWAESSRAASYTDAEIASRIAEIERVIRQARMEQLELIAEADRRRLFAEQSARSTQAWLQNLITATRRQATEPTPNNQNQLEPSTTSTTRSPTESPTKLPRPRRTSTLLPHHQTGAPQPAQPTRKEVTMHGTTYNGAEISPSHPGPQPPQSTKPRGWPRGRPKP